MRSDKQSSRPVRSLKRPLEDIDPECPPASKHSRPSPLPSPTSFIDDQLSKKLHTIGCLNSGLSSQRRRNTSKRIRTEPDSKCIPASNSPQQPSPGPSPTSSIYDWLSTLRPGKTPASIIDGETSSINPSSASPSVSQSASDQIFEKGSESAARGSAASTQTGKSDTTSALYRSRLFNNGIQMDHTGEKIPKEIKDFLETKILSDPASPQLSIETLREISDTAVLLADSAEGSVAALVGTDMFPLKRRDVGPGGNTKWSTMALPKSPKYPLPLVAPKPDFHYGYPTGQLSQWSLEENAVCDHRIAQPFSQPARGNRCPFLVIETKAEAAGGTLWLAENQAAGSGSHCVNSMRWIFEQASEVHSIVDSVAFTAVLTQREVIFHVHFYSEQDQRFYMSFIANFLTTRFEDIQRCHSTVQHIISFGLDARQKKVRGALKKLFPFPEDWKALPAL